MPIKLPADWDSTPALQIGDEVKVFVHNTNVENVDAAQDNSLADKLNRLDIRIAADKYLNRANQETWECPVCGAGTHRHHNTGLHFYTDNAGKHRLKCFSCQQNFSVLDLVCHCEHLQPSGKDFVQALKIACEIYGVDFHNPQLDAAPIFTAKVEKPAEKIQFTRLGESRNLLKNFLDEQGGFYRGIPCADYARANIGYLPDQWFKCDEQKHPALIFQMDNGNIFCRAVDGSTAKHYIGNVTTLSLNIPEPDLATATIIIVEGAIDALSILHATDWKVFVIATGGLNIKNLQSTLKRLYPAEKPNLLLMLDNDEKDNGDNPGQNAAANWLADLRAEGYAVVNHVLSDEKNLDFNAYLIRYGVDALKNRMEKHLADAQIELDSLQKEISRIVAPADKKPAKLQAELQAAENEMAELENEGRAAIETLKDVEKFDSNTVFSDEIVKAAAYAKIFDRQAYSEFARALKNYGDKNPAEKVSVNDWKADVKDAAESISAKQKELSAKINKIQAAIDTEKFAAKFLADNPMKFSFPYDFSVTDKGILKIVDDKTFLACRRPVIIAAKTKSVEEKEFKLILQYWKINGKRVTLPPRPASTVFNSAGIINLTNSGLKTSSYTAHFLVDYLDAFDSLNENKIPVTCTVPRCGWYNFDGKDIFVDPRRENFITEDDVTCPLIVDSSSQFAENLTSKGNLDEWKKAYNLAKKSDVARAIVAACVAAPLLKVLGERNFLFYSKAKSLAGKTTALLLGASAVGSEKIIRTFDATKNGFLGAAADVNDYSFLIDEKQSADNRISEQFELVVYGLAQGVGRTKLNSDSTLKKLADWRTIAVMTGETSLLDDSAKDGAFNRLLQLNAPATILDADACKKIRRIIKENYGLVMPLIIDKIFSYGKDNLRGFYEKLQNIFEKAAPEITAEYRRYVAVITLADFILNTCLGVDEETAFSDAVTNCAGKIFKYVPTKKEIDTTQKEIDFVAGFIAQNQARFIGGNVALDKMQKFYGKIEDDYTYITVAALQTACKESGYDYQKLVDDLISAGKFIPSDKIPKGCKTPLKTHQRKIGGIKTNCYKFINPADSADE